MKRLPSAAFALLTLLMMIDAVWATEYFYPNRSRPLFSVTIPDTWKVEAENELLHATPPDESVYIGFWAVEKPDMDTIGDAVAQIVDEVVKGFEIDEEDDMEINGIPFYYFSGKGRDGDDGSPLNAGVALFSPDGENFCIVLYFGSPEAESHHEQNLIGILRSIQGRSQ